ncbi:hypothetical protein O181_010523 [Austropuccinia psidii MF-1]|uniref:Uncharacterized protein n=1 Tax=Austropuccinia psidii MF-1 TaxID=1389203 RepID=A0A9Q3BT61_9BASI|nr:hypothetical protein [Austropuccinia psidii MF-1]
MAKGSSTNQAAQADTIYEIGTSKLEVVDEVHSNDPHLLQDGSNLLVDEGHTPVPERRRKTRVIGPCHPTLISSSISPTNVLPYTRRLQELITSLESDPKTFKGDFKSPEKELCAKAIRKELSSMAMLKLWDFTNLEPSFKLMGTT